VTQGDHHERGRSTTLFTFPVVVGQGTLLFPASGPDRALDLVDLRATSSGVTIQVYRPAGDGLRPHGLRAV